MNQEFIIPSEPGNEKQAAEQVVEYLKGLNLAPVNLERLKTAIAEAIMNAMEHGNQYHPDKPVHINVIVSGQRLVVQVTDYGDGQKMPEPEMPDLEAKLQGLQSPRGWGLFLIKNMVDEMHVYSDDNHHTIELVLYLAGDQR